MAEPIYQLVFFVVDEDTSAVAAPVSDLERWFHADYWWWARLLRRRRWSDWGVLRDASDEVALIICAESMRAIPGSELLARSRSVPHGPKGTKPSPGAGRGL